MTKLHYHVFTNGRDAYPDTLKEARQIFKQYKQDYGCARLYATLEDGKDILDENCLASYGGFPN